MLLGLPKFFSWITREVKTAGQLCVAYKHVPLLDMYQNILLGYKFMLQLRTSKVNHICERIWVHILCGAHCLPDTKLCYVTLPLPRCITSFVLSPRWQQPFSLSSCWWWRWLSVAMLGKHHQGRKEACTTFQSLKMRENCSCGKCCFTSCGDRDLLNMIVFAPACNSLLPPFPSLPPSSGALRTG